MTQALSGALDPTSYNDPSYDDLAVQAANRYGIPPQLMLAIKNTGEKSGPSSVSPKGATGLMQIMPSTWNAFASPNQNPRNPVDSVDVGAKYLKTLLTQYQGNAKAVIAHYNGGTAAGQAVLNGQQPPSQETQNYLKRIYGEGQQGTPLSGSLDSAPQSLSGALDSPTPPQALSGQLDTPSAPPAQLSGQLDGTPTAAAAPTPAPTDSGWDGTGGFLTGLINGAKAGIGNPAEAGKELLDSGSKIVDDIGSIGSTVLSYGGGLAAGLISGSSDVAKNVKDDLAGKLSLSKTLQDKGISTDSPDVASGLFNIVVGQPLKVIADATTTPGTIYHDAAQDLPAFLLPFAHGGLKAIADHSVVPKIMDKDAPSPNDAKPVPTTGNLFPEDPPQAGPMPLGGPLDTERPLPAKLEGAIEQARLELNKPDFQRAQDAFADWDNRGIADQTQGSLFGDLDSENPAYPNQTPSVPLAGPLDESPHPNVVEPWTTGETYLGPDAPMYKDQQSLVAQPLDGLIDQAKAASEPRPVPALQPEPPAPNVFPTSKYQQGSLDLSTPDLLSNQLDSAEKDIHGGQPTANEYMTKKDLPVVMSPKSVFSRFGITPENIQKVKGQLVRTALPNWAKRDMWNENPLLRSNFDNLSHLRDVKTEWLNDILDSRKLDDGTVFNPRRELDTLSPKERNDFAHFTIEHEGDARTPAMVQEGRNYYNAREWRDRGASDKVSLALEEAGKIYEKSLAGYNHDAALRGEEPLRAIPNYFPHRHAGDFFTKVTHLESGTQEVTPFRSLKEARDAASEVSPKLKEGFSVDYGRKQRGGSDFNDLLEALKERTNSYHGEAPSPFNRMLTKIRQRMDEEFFAGIEDRHDTGHYTGENGFTKGENPKGTQALDAEHVANSAPKYAQDMASYLNGRRITDLQEAYHEAAKEAGVDHTSNWADTEKAMEKQAELYQGPTFDPAKSTSIENFADGISKIMDRTSNIIAHSPVPYLTRDALTKRVRSLNKLASTLLINPALNTSLAISQFFQHLTSPLNVFGELSRTLGTNEIQPGFIGQLKQTGKTIPFIAQAFTKGLWDAMAPESLTSAKGNAALKWAKSLGHLDTMLRHEHLDTAGKTRRLVTFQGISMAAEHIPRSISFMQGYNAFKQLGFSEAAARRAAVEFTNTVMGDYTKEGKVEGMRHMDPLMGTALSPFSTWLWNSKAQVGALVSSLGTHGVKAIGAGTIMPLVALAAGVYYVTGWKGAPGVQDFDQIARISNAAFTTNLPTSANIHMAYGKQMFGSEDQANNAYYGWLSNKSGYDLAQSSRFGSLSDVAAPGISLGKTLAEAGYYGGKKALSQTGLVDPPTDEDMYHHMKAATPPSLKTFTDDYYSVKKPDGSEILKNGIIRKPDESVRKWTVNPFTDLDETKQKDVNAVSNYLNQRQKKLVDNQVELVTDKANNTISNVKALYQNSNLSPEQLHQQLAAEKDKFKAIIAPNVQKLIGIDPDFAQRSNELVNKVLGDQMRRNLTQQQYESFLAAKSNSINDKQNAARRNLYMQRVLSAK